ncbi:MAG: DNA glycosylase [Clostridiales bacterium]|nr:DNA glycosylase [Clostridiales bacterium]
MEYKVSEGENCVIIDGVRDFDLKHIFDCGQCFRWYEEKDGSYTGTAFGRVINVQKQGNLLIINNSDLDDFKNLWFRYFDLGRDYGRIKEVLSKDEVLNEAIKFGGGIRILRQDEWEILISFMLSTNNRIPMIKRAIKSLSEKYGKPIEYKGNTYFSFPEPSKIADADISEIEKCHTGFRAKFIKGAAVAVNDGDLDLYNLDKIGYSKARDELMELKGVGPKVSDCILLFSMGYYEAFPVDVWIKRVMQFFYLTQDDSLKKIEIFAQNKFKELAGFAQEYLFYYARECKSREISDK